MDWCRLATVFLVVVGVQLFGVVRIGETAAVDLDTFCPRILHKVFEDYVPVGGNNAGNYTEAPPASRLWPCVESCCQLKDGCNVAFVYNDKCYHVQCINNDLCLPEKHLTNGTAARPTVRMVLVNPVDEVTTWMDSLKRTHFGDDLSGPEMDASSRLKMPVQSVRSYFDNYDGGPLSINEDDILYGNGNASPYVSKSSEAEIKDIYSNLNRFAAASAVSDPLYMDSGMENDLQMDESKYYESTRVPCEIGLDRRCPAYQHCVPMSVDSRRGLCECVPTYRRNKLGECVKDDSVRLDDDLVLAEPSTRVLPPAQPGGSTTAATELAVTKKLTVSVVSKDVRLPEQEVTLAAYTVSDDINGNSSAYKYLWSLISQPSGDVNGTMSDQTKDTIKLTNLSEGLYQFKVVVTAANNVTGEAYANVTVSPQKRINRAPNVVITPDHVTVKLPTSQTILDGGTSTDDNKIVLWHWDLTEGPIGYHPVLPESSTLQLADLTQPGNYTFKLTLTDSDGAKNSSTAYVTVLKANDYPPEANAGADVIVYLPHNNVTLNGSLSTDDREIVSWEWTKESRDVSKAVDMQNTRTPFLQLSNLEKGLYTFVLKVSDISNQTSTASVNVFVKEPTNLPPIASAGGNLTLALPLTWTTLNATQSKDDLKISRYEWTQKSGPNTATLLAANASVANATGLTIGHYVFQVHVFDENNNSATDIVGVTVVQEKNTPPVANAGGDQTVTMPVNTMYLNGSKSTDDLAVTSYAWKRDGSSVAIGTVIGDSDKQPVLVLSDIVPGRYVFQLTVSDAQGLTASDTASVIVHPDPMLLDLVEITFTVDVSVLTQSEVDALRQKLILLLGDGTQLVVRNLHSNPKTGEAILIFYVQKNNNGAATTIPGLAVEQLLLDRFWKDRNILGTLVSDVRTSRCQNLCSRHGTCNHETRACMCDAFWMPDIFWFWGISQANCNWSILYVVIAIFVVFLCISSCCWFLMYTCKRNKKTLLRPRLKPQKYSPLGTHDEEAPSQARGNTTLSDSDTDSDILFESRTKPNGILRNGNSVRNGKKTRLGRRIKT